jgi:hypothetical protein
LETGHGSPRQGFSLQLVFRCPRLGHQSAQRGRFNDIQRRDCSAYYPHKITKDPLNGLNNEMGSMKRQCTASGTWIFSNSYYITYTTPGTRWPDEPILD